MKRSDALPSASRSSQAEVGVTEFSAVPAYNPVMDGVADSIGIASYGAVRWLSKTG
jgi:hypothetical protein